MVYLVSDPSFERKRLIPYRLCGVHHSCHRLGNFVWLAHSVKEDDPGDSGRRRSTLAGMPIS